MSYEVWGEPDDGPELPDGWIDEEEAEALRRSVGDLAMLVRRLVHSLRKARPDSTLAAEALEYLQREGLCGSVTREPINTTPATDQ